MLVNAVMARFASPLGEEFTWAWMPLLATLAVLTSTLLKVLAQVHFNF